MLSYRRGLQVKSRRRLNRVIPKILRGEIDRIDGALEKMRDSVRRRVAFRASVRNGGVDTILIRVEEVAPT